MTDAWPKNQVRARCDAPRGSAEWKSPEGWSDPKRAKLSLMYVPHLRALWSISKAHYKLVAEVLREIVAEALSPERPDAKMLADYRGAEPSVSVSKLRPHLVDLCGDERIAQISRLCDEAESSPEEARET